MSIHPSPRSGPAGADPAAERVLRPVPGMKAGQLLACSVSLVVAGLLLTRGFIGFNPGRPMFVIFGLVLAASATAGLAVDHVSIRTTSQRPADLLAAELSRSRRYAHPLCLLAIDCDGETADAIIRQLRGTDRAWRRRGQLRLLLPETDREEALGVAARLAPLVGDQPVSAAVFPVDALTAEGLEAALAPLRPAPQPLPNGSDPVTGWTSRAEAEPQAHHEPDAAVGEV